MAKFHRPSLAINEPVDKLPDSWLCAIGAIVFEWSKVERQLRFAAKNMLGIGMKEARVAMRDPRPNEIFLMIEELAAIYGEDIGDWGDFPTNLENGERDRNLLIHATWMFSHGKVWIQRTRGTYTIQGVGKVNRTIDPDAIEINEHWLNERIAKAAKCVEQATTLRTKTRELAQARKAAQKGTPPDHPRPDESGAVPEPPPEPAPGRE